LASSPALLSSPNVDSGPGSLQPGTYTYTFTSTKAAASPGTIYWAASFARVLPDCEGRLFTYTTPPRTLTVLTPLLPPAPMSPALVSQPVQLSITPASFRIGRPTVSYRINCSASCSGETYFQAWLVRPHRKAIRASELDLGPASVSITAPSGGHEQFTHHYSGGPLRRLKRILHEHGAVELRLSAEVSGASGASARSHTTAWLRA
jgi:hypothetical protein